MIKQYLSNTNESSTASIFQKFFELNKALTAVEFGSTLKIDLILAYISRLDVFS